MSFEWRKIYKAEEWFEQQATEWVFDYVCEFYDVEDIEDLTEEQIDEVVQYRENDLSDYSPMQMGFSNIINQWEDAQDE
jgi:predicted AlkP superfamily pyrophosphatase or phosphodiesterase